MQSLQLLFSVGLLVYSIYSLIVYSSRRSANKSAMRQLREAGQVIRRLTAEELAYLQPFLIDPANLQKPAELLGTEVYALSGESLSHGLSVNSSSTTHDTLGGVDIVLPYDARDFLGETNNAEVVLTPKFAIAIRLNEIFDLRGGRERAHLAQRQEQLPDYGRAGENAPAEQEAGATTADTEPDINLARILGQRDETVAEAAARNHPGLGLLPTLILIPACGLLMFAGNSHNFWPWLAVSLMLLALALWLIWHRRPATARRKVTRAQGSLSQIDLQSPTNSRIVSQQLFLGDKFPLVMPRHWQARASVPADSQVTLEMREDDCSVVRFGQQLSIDAEEQRFPSIYWGRHLALAGAGLVMLFTAWFFNDHIAADLAHAQAGLLGGEGQKLAQAEQALAQPPAVGNFARLQAQVRCQIPASVDNKPPAIDCRQVRWGGEPPRIDAVEIDEELQQIDSGAVLHAQRNATLDMVVDMKWRMQLAAENDLYSRTMANRPTFLLISDLSELLLSIDRECKREGIDNSAACAQLQKSLSSELLVGEGGQNPGWGALLKQARDGSLKKDEEDRAIAKEDSVETLRQELRKVAAARLQKIYEKPLQAAIDSQRGILLPLPNGLPAHDGNEAPSAGKTTDWQAQWKNYQELAKPESLHPLELTGLVVAHGKTPAGDLLLEIDSERTQANYPPALLRVLALMLGAAFLLVHGVLWLANLSRANERSQAIEAYYDQQGSSRPAS
ncbi:MAG: IgaA/UmoB family intracellular growth attenuator [Azonexus sp.]